MKNYVLFFTIALFSFSAFGQSSFKQGFVIKNNGDTLNGYIKDYRGKRNYSKCLFKDTLNNIVIEYSPSDISCYQIGDEKKYVSLNIEGKSVFVEMIVEGITDLSFYKNKRGESFYFLSSTSDTIKLTSDDDSDKVNKGRLIYAFKDAPELKETINNMGFDRNSLIAVTTDYHNKVCPGDECVVYSKSKNKYRIGLGVIYGKSNFNLQFKPETFLNANQDYDFDFFTSYGLSLSFYDPMVSERITFYTEFCVTEIELKSDEVTWEIESHRIPILIKYKLRDKKFTPQIVVGANFIDYAKLSSEGVFRDGYKAELTPTQDMMSKANIGIVGGMNLNYKLIDKLSLNFDARANYGLGNMDFYSAKLKTSENFWNRYFDFLFSIEYYF